MTVYDGYYFGGPRTLEEMTVRTDTRPSVTVVGELVLTKTAMASYAYVAIDNLPDIGLKDGDEVEVTIRAARRGPE